MVDAKTLEIGVHNDLESNLLIVIFCYVILLVTAANYKRKQLKKFVLKLRELYSYIEGLQLWPFMVITTNTVYELPYL